MGAEALFLARDLELRYGESLALALPELEIGQGESLALVGPNGSGKTSLLKALNGLLRPASGTLLFAGCPLRASAELRRRSVYLHQSPYIMAGSVAYNVAFGCRARGLSRAECERRVGDSLALLGLRGFERRGHRALSGGEAQRVALARALAAGPDILLLDEPTASADAASAELVLAALRSASARGATLVFSTHDRGLAAALASRSLELAAASPQIPPRRAR